MSKMGNYVLELQEQGLWEPNDFEPDPPDTRREAYKKARSVAGTLQRSILSVLEVFGPKTPDEVAAELGKSVLAIRPRFSELLSYGKIEKTGVRRANASGLMAKEYALKNPKPI